MAPAKGTAVGGSGTCFKGRDSRLYGWARHGFELLRRQGGPQGFWLDHQEGERCHQLGGDSCRTSRCGADHELRVSQVKFTDSWIFSLEFGGHSASIISIYFLYYIWSFYDALTSWETGWADRDRPSQGQLIPGESKQLVGEPSFLYKPTNLESIPATPSLSNHTPSHYFLCPKPPQGQHRTSRSSRYAPSSPELFTRASAQLLSTLPCLSHRNPKKALAQVSPHPSLPPWPTLLSPMVLNGMCAALV